MSSVRRTGTTTATWSLSLPCFSVSDDAGFEVNGNGSTSAVLSADGLTVAVTYGAAISIGQRWRLDDGSLDAVAGVSVPGQTGTVV